VASLTSVAGEKDKLKKKNFRISDKLSKNAGMPIVGICKRRPQGTTGAVCTSPHSHKVTFISFLPVRYLLKKGIQKKVS